MKEKWWNKYCEWRYYSENEDLVLYVNNSHLPNKKKFFRLNEEYRTEYNDLLKLHAWTEKQIEQVKEFAELLRNDNNCWVDALEDAEVVERGTMALINSISRFSNGDVVYIHKYNKPHKLDYKPTPSNEPLSFRGGSKSTYNHDKQRFIDIGE